MAIKYRPYQDFANGLCALVNIPYANLPASQISAFQTFYLNNAQEGWFMSNWMDICPYGEARFVGNQGSYPNDLSQTAYWTNTALTITANSIQNPADGRTTASKLLETVANSTHKALQSFTYIPLATYQLTSYCRPIGGRYLYLSANDGVNTYSSFFNIVNGTLGTLGANTTATMTQCANGFYICSIYFTAASGAGAGTFGPAISSDGATLSYAGTTTAGIYSWGNVLTQTTYASPVALLIPNDQLGESFIDDVFDMWRQSPMGSPYPVRQGFEFTNGGIQVISSSNWTWNGYMWTFPNWFTANYPVYLYYRPYCPNYQGAAFSTTATYTVGTNVLYTSTAGIMDFWQCAVATTANQTPDSNPSSWIELNLPDFLFYYTLYGAYADYLRMQGQFERAQEADQNAQAQIDLIHDNEERQQGKKLPFKVATHVTSNSGWYR